MISYTYIQQSSNQHLDPLLDALPWDSNQRPGPRTLWTPVVLLFFLQGRPRVASAVWGLVLGIKYRDHTIQLDGVQVPIRHP